jgi:hypothetical protein
MSRSNDSVPYITASSVTGRTPSADREYTPDDPDDIACVILVHSLLLVAGTIGREAKAGTDRRQQMTSDDFKSQIDDCLFEYNCNTPSPSSDAMTKCLTKAGLGDYTKSERNKLTRDASDRYDRDGPKSLSPSVVRDALLPGLAGNITNGIVDRNTAYQTLAASGVRPYDAWNIVEQALTTKQGRKETARDTRRREDGDRSTAQHYQEYMSSFFVYPLHIM